MARDDAATTFLFGPSTTLLLGVYIQKNESWHLWCDVALVWFFRFCCISTGKAADLSTGYSLFRGFLLRAGCMGVRCAGSGRTTQRYVARQDVADGPSVALRADQATWPAFLFGFTPSCHSMSMFFRYVRLKSSAWGSSRPRVCQNSKS